MSIEHLSHGSSQTLDIPEKRGSPSPSPRSSPVIRVHEGWSPAEKAMGTCAFRSGSDRSARTMVCRPIHGQRIGDIDVLYDSSRTRRRDIAWMEEAFEGNR